MVSYDTKNKGGYMPTTSEINAFLAQVKSPITAKNFQILDNRYKYISTLAQLGIVKQDVLDDISNLSTNENWIKTKKVKEHFE